MEEPKVVDQGQSGSHIGLIPIGSPMVPQDLTESEVVRVGTGVEDLIGRDEVVALLRELTVAGGDGR